MSNWIRRGNSVQLQVYLGKDKTTGRAIRKTKTIKYKDDITTERAWLDFYSECTSKVTPAICVSELVRRVYNEILKPRCKRQTLKGYRAAIRKIDETIGSISLEELSPYTIQRWVNDLDLAPKTVRNYLSFLRRCLRVGITWGLLEKDPAANIELPLSASKQIRLLSAEELPSFIKALETVQNLHYKVAVYLALCCGLRRGETCGLLCSDYEAGVLSVTKGLYIDGEVYEDTPKTYKATRRVVAPDFLHPSLEQLKALGGYLIKGADGGAMYPDNLWHWLNRFEKKHGLPLVSYHSLRHTYAALLCQKKVPLSQISATLGHAQITTTLDLYAYDLAPESARIEAARYINYIMTTSQKSPGPLQSEASVGGEGGIRTHGTAIYSGPK